MNSVMNQVALRHFQESDPVLFEVAQLVTISAHQPTNDYFFDLCNAIISQQLSIKVADVILARFQSLFPGEKITPEMTLQLSDEQLRAVGLSGSKTRYLKNIAEAVVSNQLQLEKLPELGDTAVVEQLVKIKGIGQWTAEMFLIVSLGREDVFSCGDLGLKKAIQRVYKLPELPTLDEMLKFSEKWSPHRTLASRILWKSLELPVA